MIFNSIFCLWSSNFSLSKAKKIDGWLTKRQMLKLHKIAKGLPENSKVIEIGSWKGKSSYCIASGLKQGSVLYCIDPFIVAGEDGSVSNYSEKKGENSLYDQFMDNVRNHNVDQFIKPLVGFSQDFVNQFEPNSVDFIFIDGDHSYEGSLYDYEHYKVFVKKGGIIAFHDYYPKRKDFGVTRVIENKAMKELKPLRSPNGMWVGQKQD